MPIYAYRCDACGFAKDVLQKISDAPLTDCPECGKAEFKKQLTAAGFQLKGTGWYATDFRNGSSSSAAPKTDSTPSAPAASTSSSEATSSSGSSASAPASDSKPAPAST
jgi:putative FmdB family regulatory protein